MSERSGDQEFIPIHRGFISGEDPFKNHKALFTIPTTTNHQPPTTNYELYNAKRTQSPVPLASRRHSAPQLRETNPICPPRPLCRPGLKNTKRTQSPSSPQSTNCQPPTTNQKMRNEPNPGMSSRASGCGAKRSGPKPRDPLNHHRRRRFRTNKPNLPPHPRTTTQMRKTNPIPAETPIYRPTNKMRETNPIPPRCPKVSPDSSGNPISVRARHAVPLPRETNPIYYRRCPTIHCSLFTKY